MHPIPKANKTELRNFGLLTGALLTGLFGLILPWWRGHTSPTWIWIITCILCSLALLAPMALQPVYQIWMRIGLVLGAINSKIILGIVFFVVLTPMGLLMRLFKYDPIGKTWDETANTYRVAGSIKTVASMEKPY